MSQHGLVRRSRLLLAVLFIALAALACSLGGGQQNATVTPGGTAAQTQVAQSDVPEVEIRSPQDNTDVVINTEVQVYVHATDRVGVTRIEMRVDNLIVDTAASPEANGTPTMDSILSWTPNSDGTHVVEVVAFRGDTRGNPQHITLNVRDTAAQVTNPAGSPAFLTASPTNDPTCRVRVDTDNLNVRSGPGINYDSITTLSVGTVAPVIGTTSDFAWYQIDIQGAIGWVSSSFVTRLGLCSTVIYPPIPASPTPQPGAPPIIIPPTFTPLPTFPPPTPTTTIPVIVLPTLTFTPYVPPTQHQVSVGDLSSTAIYATQTKLAQPAPTSTTAPTVQGVTPTITKTATLTATPLLPDLTITNILVPSTTVVLDPVNHLASVPFTIRVANIGQADAPVFQVVVLLPDGTQFVGQTNIVLTKGSSIDLTINAIFSKSGPQHVTIIADSTNAVAESNKTNNITYIDMTVVTATVEGATATSTSTPSPQPPTQTATQTATQATAQVVTQTPTQTFTLVPTSTPTQSPVATGTQATPQAATATFTLVPTTTATSTQGATQAVTNTPTATFTLVVLTATPIATTPASATPSNTPIATTATFTPSPVTPTKTLTPVPPTNTPAPPTATFTPSPVPPTKTPSPVPPSSTPSPVPATKTPSPVPPTKTPSPVPATKTPSPIPASNTPSPVPPTATPVTPTIAPTPVDLLTVPVVPDFSNPSNASMVNNVKAIYANGAKKKNDPHKFYLVGDTTLAGARAIDNTGSNLNQFFPALVPIVQYFNPGIQQVGFPTTGNGFTSTDILDKTKGTGPCQGKSPLVCALVGKPLAVFISVGQADIAANTPLSQFQTNLTQAGQAAVAQGVIPVFNTIVGVLNPADAPKLSQYNQVIYNVAQANNWPLFNLYGMLQGNPNPSPVGPNGMLTTPPAGQLPDDFSPNGLKIGQNEANWQTLNLLNAFKGTLALP